VGEEKKGRDMKKCHRCGTPWSGLGGQPRFRQVCEGCGAYLHSCVNCHHFDHQSTNACKLKQTTFVGCRSAMNYCEEFRMTDSVLRESEARLSKARMRWEALWK
jgi:hypothetical protein